MTTDMIRILKMIEEGVINAEEGSELIKAMSQTSEQAGEGPKPRTPEAPKAPLFDETFDREAFLKNDFKAGEGERFLQVRVLSAEGDKVKVNLPLNFVKGIIKVTGKLPVIQVDQMEGVDVQGIMDTILAAIENDLSGRLVDVESVKGDLVIVEIV